MITKYRGVVTGFTKHIIDATTLRLIEKRAVVPTALLAPVPEAYRPPDLTPELKPGARGEVMCDFDLEIDPWGDDDDLDDEDDDEYGIVDVDEDEDDLDDDDEDRDALMGFTVGETPT